MKPWLSYGLKGAAIGMIILLFYAGLYWPLVREYGVEETWDFLPYLTGHGEIFFLAFAFHDLPWSICPKTEEHCYSWTAREAIPEGAPCVPWEMDNPETGEKQPGCCVGKEMMASEACTAPLEAGIGLFFLGLLLALYFGLGVLYWWVRWGRKKKS